MFGAGATGGRIDGRNRSRYNDDLTRTQLRSVIMPLDYEIEDDLVILRARGDVTNEDHQVVFAEVVKDGRFRKKSKVLLFDKGGRYAPTLSESVDLVTLIKEYQEANFDRFAVLVTGLLHWSIGRMVAAFAVLSNVEFRVFRDEEIARKWLYEDSESSTDV